MKLSETLIMPLLLASVFVTGAGQILFVLVAWQRQWYSLLERLLVSLFALASSVGAIWFVLASLVGAETGLEAALVFAGGQALALSIVVYSRMKEIL
jgi:hypothetical protein